MIIPKNRKNARKKAQKFELWKPNCSLIDYYRLTGRLSEARQTLARWKEAVNGNFADEKPNQILTDGQLSYSEGNLDAAWDAFQCAYAEKRYVGLAGKRINTLHWLVGTRAQTC